MGVRYDPGGGGALAVTKWADTLIGVDRPFFIGDQYYLVGLSDNTTAPVDWASVLNIGGSGLVYGGGGLNLNGMVCWGFPSAIDYAATVAKSLSSGLFAELTIVSKPIAGVDCSIGVVLLANPGQAPGYFHQIQSQTTNTPLYRKDNVGSTNFSANTFTNNIGDVVRMETRYVAGNVEIKTYQNGVLRNTTTDNTAQKITGGGVFGLAFTGVFTGQVVVSNFNAGTL